MKQDKIYKIGIFVLVLIVVGIYAYPEINLFSSKTQPTINNNYKPLSELKNKPNIVIIVLDTTRPDHLSAYGYPRETSPNIDRLAKEGTLFTNAFTVIPYTTSSHISLMTSLYPFVYQPRIPNAQATGVVIAEDEYLTLAEILQSYDYNTAGFVSVSMMSPASGLDQGFDVYNVSEGVRMGNETVKIANEWLEENYQEPFFLWLHSYDPHDGYVPPKPFDGMHEDSETLYDEVGLGDFTAMKQALTNYDEDISWGDHNIGVFLNKLRELEIYDNTIIVFVSDHGEQFGEHLVPIYQGMGPQVVFEHARALYDQEIRIPMIIKGPGIPKNRKVDALTENVDVMPTILDLLGIPLNEDAQGVSLVPAIRYNQEVKEFVFAHLYPIISPYYKSSIRTKDFKLIYDHYNKETQLFDLNNDPEEQINLIEHRTTLVKEYETKMINLIKDNSLEIDLNIPSLESHEIKQLEELGYLVN